MSGSYFLIAFIGFLACSILSRKFLRSIRDIPGPFLASFTSLWQVYHIIFGHLAQELLNLHRKHGHFVRISDKEVSVSHPDAIKLVLGAQIAKTNYYEAFCLPDYRYVNQQAETDPDRHIQKQKNIAPGYTLSHIIKSEPQVDHLILLLEAQWDKLIKAGKQVELDKWFYFFAFDVVGEVTFSQAFRFLETGTDVRGAVANIGQLVTYISVVGHYPWFHHWTLGNPLLSHLGLQPSSHIFDTCLDAIERRKNNPQIRNDMMAQWEAVRGRHDGRMHESEIFSAAVSNLGAGGETVNATLQAFVYYLLRSPGHLQKVTDEIDYACTCGQLSDPPSYAETQKLPFLQACIRETYRVHPGIQANLPRIVPPGGISIAGRYFKPGTVLSISPYVIHRIDTIWGSDANIFNPNRWLDEKRAKELSRYLIHFGAGYNMCAGRHLAHLQVSKLAAQIIRKYEITQVDPTSEWKYHVHFTANPHGSPVNMKRRAISRMKHEQSGIAV